jgi:hypothetical protein
MSLRDKSSLGRAWIDWATKLILTHVIFTHVCACTRLSTICIVHYVHPCIRYPVLCLAT